MITVTILYAGLLGLMSLVLSASSGIMRGKKNIDAGDGGDREQLFAMRRHANFIEYVPLALILIGLLEFNGVAGNTIHYLGAALLVGRVLHAAFFTQGVKSVPRGIGAGITALVIATSSIWLLTIYF
jgi:uncharacterized membrane protein YecN with MAPEG domain